MITLNQVNVKCSKTVAHLPIILTVKYTERKAPVQLEWDSYLSVELTPKANQVLNFPSPASVCRFLARISVPASLYGSTILEKTEVDHWIEFASRKYGVSDFKSLWPKLNSALSSVTYLVGNNLTLADIFVWSLLYGNKHFKSALAQGKTPSHLSRWFNFLKESNHFASSTEGILLVEEDSVCESNHCELDKMAKDDVGKFIDLPGAEMGKVVVRFPPEASGFLHIGHAKAALLNAHYQTSFNGKLILRFDDTNPEKEKEDFEKVILEDVATLQIKPNQFTYTSDHFNLLLIKCEELLKKGLAFVDDTDPETMKAEREKKVESKNRNNSVKKNLALWKEMKEGTDHGKTLCIRAKIDMSSANGCMRDPTLYRCKTVAHPRTGTLFNVYPTYDFACPIVDSIEGVTHALRTTEYHDRDEQYFWVLDSLGLRKPHIYEYSRLNMTNTVLSKRKLTWFVEQGYVEGWDDPRMPTVRGIMRQGMTVEGLKKFIIAQGSSRSVVVMEWDKIWAFNKKIIDPIAPRYTAVEEFNRVTVIVENIQNGTIEVTNHPKNPDLGTKSVEIGPKLLIDQTDAAQMKVGENVTFINWGNLIIKTINKANDGKIESIEAVPNLENKDFKKTLKVTWVAASDMNLVPCVCQYYVHLVYKPILGKDEDFKSFINNDTRANVAMLGEPYLASLKKGDIIQIQRKGYFICDAAYDTESMRHTSRYTPLTLISIPDGSKDLSTLPDAARQLRSSEESKKEKLNSKKGKLAEKSPQDEGYSICDSPSGDSGVCFSSRESIESLDEQIKNQGEKIRKLKAEKADKKVISSDVEVLLKLKTQYKSLSGNEWKPDAHPSVRKPESTSVDTCESQTDFDNQIKQQGEKIRAMKSEKATKAQLSPEIEKLLALKASYKALVGQDWKPDANTTGSLGNKSVSTSVVTVENQTELDNQIKQQGEKIRIMKSEKATKTQLSPEIEKLLALKASYKTIVGQDWKPDANVSGSGVKDTELTTVATAGNQTDLDNQIKKQGEKIRIMKLDKATKEQLSPEIEKLLALKASFKTLVGEDWKPPASTIGKAEDNKKPKETPKPDAKKSKNEKNLNKKDQKVAPEDENIMKKVTRLGLESKKEENLADWYSQVITKGEMIEYYDISGCYILRPWAYSIWESIVNFFDPAIKALGVSNSYFPMFVSPQALEKEKTHISDFAPEVAWVTRSGSSDLAEPIAIRPTSETVMYPSYAKWIRSHRDLPLQLNQWCSVVRWEFKNPQPFLRTREFLWQEGHTAFATREEAVEEVHKILDLYAQIYENLLAIPVVRGRKTEKEKFAGADFTTTVEAYVPANGRAVQGATSHHLGQNFSKMFEIVFEDPAGGKCFVHQNSWGLSTRTIGVVVMVHGDNTGLVIPPRVVMYQVVIVPCGITAELSDKEKANLLENCKAFESQLVAAKIRVKGDYRDNYSPGWKYNHWELKGVPIRVEIGPRDIKKNQFIAVRRDTGEKVTMEQQNCAESVQKLLDDIHNNLYERAKKELDKHMVVSEDWNDFCKKLDNKCIIQAPFCGDISCEDKIKADSARNDDELLEPGAPSMGAKSLCIPFNQPKEITDTIKCINPTCKNKPKNFTLFGRSY